MFARMGTLDHAIRDLITAHLKRAGVSGRRFGLDVLGNPGFAAPLKRRRRTSPDAGDKPPGGHVGRWPVHDLCGLDGRIAKDERVVAVESEDDCVRNGREIATGENKFSAYSSVVRSTQECSIGYVSWQLFVTIGLSMLTARISRVLLHAFNDRKELWRRC